MTKKKNRNTNSKPQSSSSLEVKEPDSTAAVTKVDEDLGNKKLLRQLEKQKKEEEELKKITVLQQQEKVEQSATSKKKTKSKNKRSSRKDSESTNDLSLDLAKEEPVADDTTSASYVKSEIIPVVPEIPVVVVAKKPEHIDWNDPVFDDDPEEFVKETITFNDLYTEEPAVTYSTEAYSYNNDDGYDTTQQISDLDLSDMSTTHIESKTFERSDIRETPQAGTSWRGNQKNSRGESRYNKNQSDRYSNQNQGDRYNNQNQSGGDRYNNQNQGGNRYNNQSQGGNRYSNQNQAGDRYHQNQNNNYRGRGGGHYKQQFSDNIQPEPYSMRKSSEWSPHEESPEYTNQGQSQNFYQSRGNNKSQYNHQQQHENTKFQKRDKPYNRNSNYGGYNNTRAATGDQDWGTFDPGTSQQRGSGGDYRTKRQNKYTNNKSESSLLCTNQETDKHDTSQEYTTAHSERGSSQNLDVSRDGGTFDRRQQHKSPNADMKRTPPVVQDRNYTNRNRRSSFESSPHTPYKNNNNQRVSKFDRQQQYDKTPPTGYNNRYDGGAGENRWSTGSSGGKYKKFAEDKEDKEFSEFMQMRRNGKRINNGKLKEIVGDLFTAPNTVSLAHCVAEDFAMGAGIAVIFKSKFKRVGELLDQKQKTGGLAFLEDNGRYIFYLVTKEISQGKPTIYTLWMSLKRLRDFCREHEVKQLAMPQIGCGLDRLDWNQVKDLLEFAFQEVDIEIVVYILQDFQAKEENQPKRAKVVHDKKMLKDIESGTALLYLGSESGAVSKEIRDLSEKYTKLPHEYKNASKSLGDVIQCVDKNECIYGLIVKTKDDSINYASLEKCLKKLKNLMKTADLGYVGLQAFTENDRTTVIDKIIPLMQHILYETEIWICWPEELKELCPK